MSTCKECLFFEACNYWLQKDNRYLDAVEGFICQHFKDRSKFIELPCKVGDTIYQIVYCYDRTTYPATKYPDHYVEKEVVGIHICDSRLRVNALSNKKYRDYLIVGVCNSVEHIPFAKIGKTVFPTKEEAEKALAEKKK